MSNWKSKTVADETEQPSIGMLHKENFQWICYRVPEKIESMIDGLVTIEIEMIIYDFIVLYMIICSISR